MYLDNLKKKILFFIALLSINIYFFVPIFVPSQNVIPHINTSISLQSNSDDINVTINIDSESTIYEGDIINCTIIGDPKVKYWQINGQAQHTTFFGDNPVIFNPEPTPLNDEFTELRVFAKNDQHSDSDTVKIRLKRLYFGDIHFHSKFSDGYNHIDTIYQNAINDNYVDFVCLTDHAEIINGLDYSPPQPIWMFMRSFIQSALYKIGLRDEWQTIKEKAIEYYDAGSFTTFLGFEYSPGPWYPGGFPWSKDGHEDVGHLNFYYKDIYLNAPEYSAHEYHTWHDIFQAMNEEYNKGHYNFCFPHHSIATFGMWGAYTVNWTYLADKVDDSYRDKLLRGAEVYSKWGQSIGRYSNIPITWSYSPLNIFDFKDYWVENALWEWSAQDKEGQRFVITASSDNHATDRPASASMQSRVSSSHPNPAGIIAAYSVHNTRSEIWDAINSCDCYGSQLLKIRANVRFDNKMAIGRWINCTAPLNIQITTHSTFPGVDSGGKNMCPNAYDPNELDYPIQDVWIIKKDTDKGQPWCKILYHVQPDCDFSVLEFEDQNVKPNDFYYIVIRQKGQYLSINNNHNKNGERNEYLCFLGPVFIKNVE